MAAAFAGVPPFFRLAEMPAARKVWLSPDFYIQTARAPANHGVSALLGQVGCGEFRCGTANGGE